MSDPSREGENLPPLENQDSGNSLSQLRTVFQNMAERTTGAAIDTVVDTALETVIDFNRPGVMETIAQLAGESQPMQLQPGGGNSYQSHTHSHQPHAHSHNFQQRVPGNMAGMSPPPSETPNRGGGAPDQQPDWRQILKMCQFSGPFALLISVKLVYDHRLGLLLFACLMGTFYYANMKLEREIYNTTARDSRQNRSKLTILGIIVLLLVNVATIYYVFADQELYRSLYFHLPRVDTVDFWNLAWIMVITDFVLKFSAIIIKGLISLIPRAVLSHNRRGRYYMFTEEIIQFYRFIVTVRPWLHYLADTQHGGQIVSYVLLLVYTVCKANLVYKNLIELKTAFKRFRVDKVFGMKPSREDLKATGDYCPICQDDYRSPVQLTCKHIFCEDCVSIWFDREKTCPMCRAQIADNPQWRDGATSGHIQWY